MNLLTDDDPSIPSRAFRSVELREALLSEAVAQGDCAVIKLLLHLEPRLINRAYDLVVTHAAQNDVIELRALLDAECIWSVDEAVSVIDAGQVEVALELFLRSADTSLLNSLLKRRNESMPILAARELQPPTLDAAVILALTNQRRVVRELAIQYCEGEEEGLELVYAALFIDRSVFDQFGPQVLSHFSADAISRLLKIKGGYGKRAIEAISGYGFKEPTQNE